MTSKHNPKTRKPAKRTRKPATAPIPPVPADPDAPREVSVLHAEPERNIQEAREFVDHAIGEIIDAWSMRTGREPNGECLMSALADLRCATYYLGGAS